MSQKLTFQSLEIEIQETENEAIYTFTGDMNESFDHTKVPRLIKSKITLLLKKILTLSILSVSESG